MKLIWSLAKKSKEPHSDFVYDMFWVSMRMAKDLGYEIVLYGTSDAIEKLSELCDEVINVDEFDYMMHDDIKIHIWESRTDNYCTIDGDLFLYKPIKLFNQNELHIETTEKILTKEAYDGLQIFNSFNPTTIIKEWKYNEIACNTGLVKWGNESEFKKNYILNYKNFREWYLYNSYDMKSKNSILANTQAVPSHFICENLLYQLLRHYNINFNNFSDNINNNYIHWAGPNKFKDGKKKLMVYNIVIEGKQNPLESIKNICKRLENKGLPKVFDF
jgi:hypothetical protein